MSLFKDITRHSFFIPCPELYICICICTSLLGLGSLQYACLSNFNCLSCDCQLFLNEYMYVYYALNLNCIGRQKSAETVRALSEAFSNDWLCV